MWKLCGKNSSVALKYDIPHTGECLEEMAEEIWEGKEEAYEIGKESKRNMDEKVEQVSGKGRWRRAY